MPEHQLQNQWVFWDFKSDSALEKSDYSSLFREICEFRTVEGFWKHWAAFTPPSSVFSDGIKKKVIDGRVIKALNVFKKGIRPEWEDPANSKGWDLLASKNLTLGNLDAVWENVVLALIGETIDVGDEICGCRVVDSCKKGKALYKIEIWLRSKDQAKCNAIKEKMIRVGLGFDPESKAPLSFDVKAR
mmetsp:Transcript_20932/g.29995  ORF Transcript_20932/g.29995 Transcript_20932/m.29995 type:complete len:188 (-) Transcript_20932:81-644(-)